MLAFGMKGASFCAATASAAIQNPASLIEWHAVDEGFALQAAGWKQLP
jgi:hypothetical protein